MGFGSSGIETTSSWSLWKTTREFIEKARKAAVVDGRLPRSANPGRDWQTQAEIGKPKPRSNRQPPRPAHPSPDRRLSVNPKPCLVLPKLFLFFLLWRTERERRIEGENGEERESRGKKNWRERKYRAKLKTKEKKKKKLK